MTMNAPDFPIRPRKQAMNTKHRITLGSLSAALLTGALAVGIVAQRASNRPALDVAAEEVRAAEVATRIDNDVTSLVARISSAYVLFSGGSGVCISEDGYVITNHHVSPESARRYEVDSETGDEEPVKLLVQMAGTGREYTARPIGADPRGDIVLCKIDVPKGEKLPFVKLGDSEKVQTGDVLVAIGNPFLVASFAYEPSISKGVVSAVNRFQGGYNACIQTDAALNPGNSGGPAFNIQGELIGINGRILTSHNLRFNTGAGFTIPINQIRRFIAKMKGEQGDIGGATVVRHGLVPGLALDNQVGNTDGARVLAVRPESVAAVAGIRAGDRITAVNGMPVRGVSGYFSVTQAWPQGSKVELTLVRVGDSKQGGGSPELKTHNVTVALDAPVILSQSPEYPRAEDPAEEKFIYQSFPDQAPVDAAGMAALFRVDPPSATIGVKAVRSDDGANPRGLVITSAGTEAEASGLRDGDVITKIEGRTVLYGSDVVDVLLGHKSGDSIKITVNRDGSLMEITHELGRAPSSKIDPAERLRGMFGGRRGKR
jgi:S1-C subfamily serine protease